MVYRKVVAQMIDVLEEREVERLLCVQDVHEDVKDDDIVMMVCLFRIHSMFSRTFD